MLSFREMFNQAKSFEIEYKEKIVNGFYSYSRLGKSTLKFSFISSKSQYTQAIMLSLSQFNGNIFINKNEVKKSNSTFFKLNFWQDTSPDQFEVQIDLIDGLIAIGSGADPLGDKKICQYLSGGNAMIIEKLMENKFRFHCNDFENDDDFDDLVFEMKIIS